MKTFYRCVWGMMVSLLCGVGQANADSSSLDSIQTLGEVMVTANRYNEVIPSQKLTGKELKALNSFRSPMPYVIFPVCKLRTTVAWED